MRVPTYDEPQVQQRALPTVRQDARDFTGSSEQFADVAQVAGQAGDQLQRNAARMQDRDDADALFRTEAAVVADYQRGFEAPARERRGHKAVGLTNEAGQWWDKAAAKFAEGLGTERQRRLFGNRLTQLKQQSIGSMSTFEAAQRRESLRESTGAGIVADINLAAANPGDAEVLKASRENIGKKIAILSDLEGYDEATRKGKHGEALTQLHSQVLEGLLDKNPSEAKAYFDANKGEIDGSKRAEIERHLKTGTLRTLAQTAADELAGGALTESEAIAKARKKYEGDEEAAVVSEIKTRFTERDQARSSFEKATADDAWKAYADAGYKKDAIPNSLWARLDGRTKIAIDADYAGRLSGADVKTNWDTYDKLRALARDEPGVFAKTDLRPFYSQLGKAEREALTDKKDAIAKGDDVATLEQQLAAVHNQMDWDAGDKENKGRFDSTVHRALAEEQKATGKVLNWEARQKVIDRMVLESNTFFSKRYYEVYGTEDAAEFDPEIPDAERTKIEAALTRANKPISEAEVLRLFKRKHGL